MTLRPEVLKTFFDFTDADLVALEADPWETWLQVSRRIHEDVRRDRLRQILDNT